MGRTIVWILVLGTHSAFGQGSGIWEERAPYPGYAGVATFDGVPGVSAASCYPTFNAMCSLTVAKLKAKFAQKRALAA
jgi:hypothetical protein